MGSTGTETFAISDELPDGTTATAETIIDVVNAGTVSTINGELKFVADVPAGKKKPVLVIFSAAIMPNSDISLIADDFASLSFEGDVYQTSLGFYKEYLMASA